jgi:hypothetical protein
MTVKSISQADLALTPSSQGQYDSELKILEHSIAADEQDKLYFQQIGKHLRVNQIYAE